MESWGLVPHRICLWSGCVPSFSILSPFQFLSEPAIIFYSFTSVTCFLFCCCLGATFRTLCSGITLGRIQMAIYGATDWTGDSCMKGKCPTSWMAFLSYLLFWNYLLHALSGRVQFSLPSRSTSDVFLSFWSFQPCETLLLASSFHYPSCVPIKVLMECFLIFICTLHFLMVSVSLVVLSDFLSQNSSMVPGCTGLRRSSPTSPKPLILLSPFFTTC